MSDKNKQININIFVNILSFAVTTLTSFFMTPYIVNKVGMEAYGIIGLANSFTNYITIITSALNSMASRFIIIELHKNNDQEANIYFNSVLIANSIIAFIIMVPSLIFIFNIEKFLNISQNLVYDTKWTFFIIFFNFSLGLITSVFGIVYYAKNRLELGALRNLEGNIIRVLIIILLFNIVGVKVQMVSIATLITGIYSALFGLYYTRKMIPIIKVKYKFFRVKYVLMLIKSGIWNSIGRLSQILLDGLDLLIANIFIGGGIMGNISISKTFTSILITLISLISDSFLPQFLKAFTKEDENKSFEASIIMSMKYNGFAFNILCSLLIVFSLDLYKLWMPGEDAVLLNNLTMVGLGPIIISGSIYSLFSVFTVTNKVKQNSIALLITGVLSSITVFILLKLTDLGVYAIVGVSSFYGILRNLFFTPMYAAYCLKIKSTLFYKQIFKNIFYMFLLVMIFIFIKSFIIIDNWISFFMTGITCFIVGCILNFLLFLNKNEKSTILLKLKNKIRIINK